MIYLISVIIALAASAVEAVSYIGFVHNHISIRAYHLFLLSIFLAFTYKHPTPKLIGKLLPVIAVISSTLYLVLIFAETATYPNFVFTTTHVNPFTFQIFIGLLWFHTLVVNKYSFAKSLLIASLMFVGIDGVGRTLAVAYKNLRQAAEKPFATYSEKMADTYPGFYPAMQEIKKLAPADSVIFIPPQGNPWEIEGNVAMVTYFLYPRKVVNLDPAKLAELPPNSYLLIAKGSWQRTGEVDYGWPKVAVPASQIWLIDPTTGTVHGYARDYDPTLDKWDWGLIKVKYE